MTSRADPEVSAIIVNWNGVAFLPRCLASLAAALRDISSEVIFVDNASSDGSVTCARREYPSASLIELARNVGFAAGCNVGLKEARGRYLLLLNTDTEVPRDTLTTMLARMREDAAIGILGCAHYDASGSEQVSYHMTFGGPIECETKAGVEAESSVKEVAWVSGACLLARRELYDEIGGLDERFPLYCEDEDWCYRTREAGWKTCWTGDATIVHDVGGSSGRLSHTARRRLQVLSQAMLYDKYVSRWQWRWWLAGELASAYWGVLACAVRFPLRPRRRRIEQLRLKANECAAFLGAAQWALSRRAHP